MKAQDGTLYPQRVHRQFDAAAKHRARWAISFASSFAPTNFRSEKPIRLGGITDDVIQNATVYRMPETILIALSTFPDAEIARRISDQLVSENFAACANILPKVESIYRWKKKVESANETLVLFKISNDRQRAFRDKLQSLHPYDVPEIIFVPASGLPDYLRWVAESCGHAR